MKLSSKPDMEIVEKKWDCFWNGEVHERPLVLASCLKPEKTLRELPYSPYYYANTNRIDEYLDWADEWIECAEFPCELVPSIGPNLGPDQFGAFLGTSLEFNMNDPATNWAKPVVTDWRTFLPLKIERANKAYTTMLSFVRKVRARGKGKYLCQMIDLHSNADALSAVRHPDKLCMDFYDAPDLMRQAFDQVKKLYHEVFNEVYEAAGLRETGSTSWMPFYCKGRYSAVQVDFCCFVGSDIFRSYILPCLIDECNSLERSVFHLDGPGALTHLDDILSIKKLDVVQWLPGAGKPNNCDPCWRHILKKIRGAGKGLLLYPQSMKELQEVHRDLGPAGTVYHLYGTWYRKDIFDAIKWLEKNS